MKNFHSKLLCLIFFSILVKSNSVLAQCSVVDTANGFYGFNDPNGSGSYSGFLCAGVDSVGTLGTSGYFDGDGYVIKLVAGSQISFSVDSCTGNPVSITVNDSSNTIIPAAYTAAACPNLLNFTAPYSGAYIIVLNLNGVCGGGGTTLIGQVYATIQTGSTPPPCPDANLINDTICGAIPLAIDSAIETGNSSLAYPTDPLDGYIIALGDSCSPPNNTLWYSFSPQTNIDTTNLIVTSQTGSNFHSWVIIFNANDPADACSGGLEFVSCNNGPNAGAGIDTVGISLYNLTAGSVYFFMIDGFSGASGPFSISLQSGAFNDVDHLDADRFFSVYPNPATSRLNIKSAFNGSTLLTITNSIGQVVLCRKYDNLSDEEIDISLFVSGIYAVKIAGAGGTFLKKLIIRN